MTKRGQNATKPGNSSSLQKGPDGKAVSQLRPAHNLLEALLTSPGASLAPAYQRFRLEQMWPELVGSAVSQNSKPLSYLDGVLTLSVSHPTWLHQLTFLKSDLIQRINETMGQGWVVELKFQVRPVERLTEETESSNDREGNSWP